MKKNHSEKLMSEDNTANSFTNQRRVLERMLEDFFIEVQKTKRASDGLPIRVDADEFNKQAIHFMNTVELAHFNQ